MRLLTQAGSGTLFENSATSGPPGCTSQVARRPCVVSDRRAKQNIVRVGTHPMGMGLYLFEYREPHASRFGNGRMFGVMADEVREVMPDAVERQPDGFDAVRYDLLGIELVH